MEKLYRKKSNGRYESVGYNIPDISDGIWLVQSKPGIKSISSLVWKVGDLKEPVNVVDLASLHTIKDNLINWLNELQKENSETFNKAKDLFKGHITDNPKLYNISSSDFIDLLLNEIYKNIKNG